MADEIGDFWPGKTLHVVPGASATHFAFVSTRHKNVYTSVSGALGDAVASRGDVIFIYPGTHTFTASLAMSKAGVSLLNAAWLYPNLLGEQAILDMTGTADELINITAANCKFMGLTFIGTTAQKCIDFDSASHNTLFKNCSWDMFTPTVSTSTKGLVALGAAKNLVVDGCGVESDGAQGNWIDATGTLQALIDNCKVNHTLGTWASVILTGAATKGLLVRGSDFDSYGTAVTVGINGTGANAASGVAVSYCNFGNLYTVPVDNYDAAECELNECYKRGVGAADGGAKITAIT